MRKRIKYYSITNGHIVAIWHIVYLVSRYKGITASDAVSIVEKSGKLGGTVPVKHGLKICIDYDIVRVSSGILQLTEITEEIILPKCNDEDPSLNVIRELLFHLLSYHNFEWLIFYNPDSEIFRESILANDPEWVSLLDNGRLFDFDDDSVNFWWDKILVKYEDIKEKIKKAIGDVGEKLTYHLELDRVSTDGFNPPKSYVKWASRISDKFGFDILSLRGNKYAFAFKQTENIQIEVKSSDAINIEKFRFFISKPEWNKALDNLNSYFFYCWIGINIEIETAHDGPFVIPATHLLYHIPKDTSDLCEWSECRCVLDISGFKV